MSAPLLCDDTVQITGSSTGNEHAVAFLLESAAVFVPDFQRVVRRVSHGNKIPRLRANRAYKIDLLLRKSVCGRMLQGQWTGGDAPRFVEILNGT